MVCLLLFCNLYCIACTAIYIHDCITCYFQSLPTHSEFRVLVLLYELLLLLTDCSSDG